MSTTLRTRATAGLATAVALVCLGACTANRNSASGGGSSAATDSVFTMPLGNSVSADPVQSTNIGNLKIIRAAYEGLVDARTGGYDVQPGLATKWTTTDQKTWTFTLRQGVRFADGTAFTADAVIANFARYRKLGGQVGGLLSGVSSVTAPDASTVRITLSAPNSGFIDYLPMAVIVSPKALTAHASDDAKAWLSANTDGTGPYQTAAPLTGSTRTLVRNAHYWGGWQGSHISKVVFTAPADNATALQQLQRGDLDRVENIPLAPYLKQLQGNKNVSVYQAPGTQIDEIQMNTQHGPLANKLLRQAVTYAYDYEAAVKAAYDGAATVPAGGLPVGFSGFDPSLTPYKQDLAKAKQLLARSGLKNITLTVWWDEADNVAFEKAQALVLKSSLAAIGIKVNIVGTSFQAMSKAAASPESSPDFNFLWHGAITADPVEYLGGYFQSKYIGGYNWSFYKSAAFDSALAEASAAASTAARDGKLAEAQKILRADAPALFVATPKKIEVVNSRFTGFAIHPIDYGYDIDFYTLRVKS
ncbi:ABC transporter substrate-binding protein [Streptomyces shenzhenensis]|uniref:ABC transporter substrate-binding protein n=1 Tax=Streptomyces shenzhenensis TaxID=943815 RepID=UPI003D941BC0